MMENIKLLPDCAIEFRSFFILITRIQFFNCWIFVAAWLEIQ